MSPVLAIISRDLLGVHAKVGDIERDMRRWALAAGGAAGILGGTAIAAGLVKLAEHGSEVNHQLELMKLQGMEVAEVHQSMAAAMATSGNVLTSVYSENLKHVRELRYAFGDTPDAVKYLEAVTKANAALNAVKGGGQDQVWELVKSLEQKGLTAKPDEFMSYIAQMTKAIVASGGRVTPGQFFSTFKYGRTAMLGWDETFITQFLPRLIQSMSGGGAGGGSGSGGPGNALMSAFAKVVQGQMPKTAAEEFARMGLAPGGIAHIKGSSQTQITGGIKGADLFQANPYAWVQQVLMPALAQHGITEQNRIIEEISRMFPVRTASQIITEMGLQGRFKLGDQSPFEKDARLQREAFDERMSYDEMIKNDWQTMMLGFHAQWETLQQVVGQPLTAPGGGAVQALASITLLLNAMSTWAGAHPESMRAIIDVVVALGASLFIAGLVALGAAIAPLVGVGAILVGMAAGFAALAALNWGTIGKMFEHKPNDPQAFANRFRPVISPPAPPATPAVLPLRSQLLQDQHAGGINVTVKAETDNPEGLAHRIASMIVEMLHTASVHNQAQGQGTLDSTFTTGGYTP
jgi:hypothetical protein